MAGLLSYFAAGAAKGGGAQHTKNIEDQEKRTADTEMAEIKAMRDSNLQRLRNAGGMAQQVSANEAAMERQTAGDTARTAQNTATNTSREAVAALGEGVSSSNKALTEKRNLDYMQKVLGEKFAPGKLMGGAAPSKAQIAAIEDATGKKYSVLRGTEKKSFLGQDWLWKDKKGWALVPTDLLQEEKAVPNVIDKNRPDLTLGVGEKLLKKGDRWALRRADGAIEVLHNITPRSN